MRVVLCVLIILSCTIGLSAKSGAKDGAIKGRDTTFIKRPYYLGITVGYIQYLHITDENRFAPPVYLYQVGNSGQTNFGFSPAFQISFPFLRRMECEAAVQRTTWFRMKSEISEYHYAATFGHEIVGFRTTVHWFDVSTWELRTVFSYEFNRKGNHAVTAGLGGWLDLQDKGQRVHYGAEAQVKCYLESEHAGNWQVALSAGGNDLDLYASLRVGLMIKGTRTYRVKPDKYYTRTYEEGE